MLRGDHLPVNAWWAGLVSLGLVFLAQPAAGQLSSGALTSSAEMRVSSPPTHCDYSLEDPRRAFYNFEFPKLLLLDNEDPIIAFVDGESKRLLFAGLSTGGVKVSNSIPSFGQYMWEKWPVVFVKDNTIYLAVEGKTPPEKSEQYRIRLLSLDRNTNALNLHWDKVFTVRGRQLALSGLYLYKDKYVVVGSVSDPHFTLLGLLSGHGPTFRKNVSFVLGDEKVIDRSTIEEEGWFGARYPQYIVSETGVVHGAWVRSTSGAGYTPRHDEGVYLSASRDGSAWMQPAELYSVKGTEYNQVRNISLAASGDSAFVLWQDTEKGFFVAEIRDGGQRDVTQISDMKRAQTDPPYFDPFSGAPTAKLAADRVGNVYALWIWNADKGPRAYQAFLSARIKGTWKPPVVVSRGPGIATLPDMQVDKAGVIHIAYVGRKPQEQYACHYVRVGGIR